MGNASRRRALGLLVRIVVTAGALFLAFRLVDFRDRVILRLRSGETLEAVRVREEPGRVIAREEDGPDRVLATDEILDREERPGLAGILRRADPARAGVALGSILLAVGCLAARWRVFLVVNGFAIPYHRVFSVTYAGGFFNLILPGSIGGDVARAIMVLPGESRKAGLVGTLFVDRLVGLGTMIGIAGVAVLPFLGRPSMRPAVLLVAILAVAGAAAYLAYFNPSIRRSGIVQAALSRVPFRAMLEQVDEVLKTMRRAPRAVAAGALWSCGAQVFSILAVYILAGALRIEGVRLDVFFLLEPIIFLAGAVPISIGGWGVQEMATAELFGMVGMLPNQAVGLSLATKLAWLTATLPAAAMVAAGSRRDVHRASVQ